MYGRTSTIKHEKEISKTRDIIRAYLFPSIPRIYSPGYDLEQSQQCRRRWKEKVTFDQKMVLLKVSLLHEDLAYRFVVILNCYNSGQLSRLYKNI